MILEHERNQPPPIDTNVVVGGGPYRCNGADVRLRLGRADVRDFSVLHVYQTVGGKQLDRAVIAMRLTAPLSDRAILPDVDEVSIEAEVELPAGAGGGKIGRQVYFWGFVSGIASFDATNQILVVEAGQAPYHFGRYVRGQVELSPGGSEFLLEADLVFNPQWDAVSDQGKRVRGLPNALGAIRGNRDERKSQAGHFAIMDPLRTFTEIGRRYNTGKKEQEAPRGAAEGVQIHNDVYWTLPQVVHYLCWHCNGEEKYFKNPTLEELEEAIDPESPDELIGGGGGEKPPEPQSPTEPGGELNPNPPAPLDPKRAKRTEGRFVRDLRVPLGTYLPQALDLVLNRYGYTWHVDYATTDERRIRIVKRGKGDEKILRWQHHEEVELDTARTWTDGLHLNVGLQSLVNAADVRGDYRLYEATFELVPAWNQADDGLSENQLMLGHVDHLPRYADSHRKWVLNEAGDYNGFVRNNRPLQAYDFKPVFGVFTIPRRRRFHPCITLGKDRQPIGYGGYDVEFSTDAGQTWKSVKELDNGVVDILASECGIRFSGIVPPPQLRQNLTTTKVRITASVYSDERVCGGPPFAAPPTAERSEESIQPEEATQFIEAGNRYYAREVTRQSKYFEQVRKGELDSSKVDDTERAKQFARDFVRAWDQADVSGTISLPYLWVPEEIKLGDVLTDVDSRGIDLEIGNAYDFRYPQVTGIHYDFQENRTELSVETFRDTRYV